MCLLFNLTLDILVAKHNALTMTPTMTPKAKLLVNNTIATVKIITKASVRGARLINLNDFQSNVPTETITMIAARIGIGICTTQSPKTIIKMIKNTPAVR